MTSCTATYKGWIVSVNQEKNLCANFSFDITSPTGVHHHVAMGGDSEQRALARAREMIDMELALAGEE